MKRYAPLAATGAETDEQLADLRHHARSGACHLAASLAARVSAQRQIGRPRRRSHRRTRSSRRPQAQLNQIEARRQTTPRCSAPIAGRVGDSSVRVGQFVQPGTRLMTVVPVQDVYLVANFKETQIGRMRVGQPATIHVDALPGADLHGAVDSFSPGTGAQFALLPPENATGNFTKIVQRVPVRIRVDAGAGDARGAAARPVGDRRRRHAQRADATRTRTRGIAAAEHGHGCRSRRDAPRRAPTGSRWPRARSAR